MIEKKWILKETANENLITKLTNELKVERITANLLINKGIETKEEAMKFLGIKKKHIYDPFLMKGVKVALQILKEAISEDKKILLYGDYDVDGTTSVSLMYLFLQNKAKYINYYIPNRYKEGYGLSDQGIEFAIENKVNLLITLDCGITATRLIKKAEDSGISVIVIDHHTPAEILPEASSIINPKQKDCNYPFKELSACGVAFKFLQAFAYKNDELKKELWEFIDIVAVSTACDIVPMIDENRVLTHYGLEKLNKNPSLGLKEIISMVGLSNARINVSSCVFRIGPKINAAGRIDDAKKSVQLLCSEDKETRHQLAKQIMRLNEKRQRLDGKTVVEAAKMIAESEQLQNAKSTVLYNENWDKGIVGIVASRLIENHYYRPTIIFASSSAEDELISASARSVENFNLYDAIAKCQDLIENFGGHKYAAGLTIKKTNLKAFQKKFEEVVSNSIKEEDLIPKIPIDAKLELKEVSDKLYRELQRLEPFGPQNMTPVFVSKSVNDSGWGKHVGKENEHLKLSITSNQTNEKFSAIAFGFGDFYKKINQKQKFDICYSLEENYFNGKSSLQFAVKDIRLMVESTPRSLKM